jgi:hypothetical protein
VAAVLVKVPTQVSCLNRHQVHQGVAAHALVVEVAGHGTSQDDTMLGDGRTMATPTPERLGHSLQVLTRTVELQALLRQQEPHSHRACTQAEQLGVVRERCQ